MESRPYTGIASDTTLTGSRARSASLNFAVASGRISGCFASDPAMTTHATTSYGDTAVVMDGSLWGNLRHFIDLRMIYGKLPLAPFFRLRLVSQDWNRLASDRQFLYQTFQSPIAHPFFIVTHKQFGHRLLTYQASSRCWSFSPLPLARCEVSGLLYELSGSSNHVFDIHTRVFHTLPLPVLQVSWLHRLYRLRSIFGMIVDTSVKPYDFKVIIADFLGTWIFDSKSGAWTQTASKYLNGEPADNIRSCVLHEGILNILVGTSHHRYYLESDVWDYAGTTSLSSDIGLWRGQLFVAEIFDGNHLSVWNHSTSDLEERRANTMPGDFLSWILNDVEMLHRNLRSKFCGEYVLVYNCVFVTDRAVLFNLDRRTWDKVELPAK